MTSSRSYSPEYLTARATSPPCSPPTSIIPDSMPETPPISPAPVQDRTLKPGIYKIVSDVNPECVIDLSGYDLKSVIVYGKHDGDNQKWEIARLGPGYSIRCLLNGAFITLNSGLVEGGGLVATPYPVSWGIEADDYEAGIYRIHWPSSPFVVDFPDETGNIMQLSNRYPFEPTRLWRFVPINVADPPQPPASEVLQFSTTGPNKSEPVPPLITSADTVIDAEGLKLGGNGEMSITTTTTTVTTSVTVVKRLGGP